MKLFYKTEKILLPDELFRSVKKGKVINEEQIIDSESIEKLEETTAIALYEYYPDKLFPVMKENITDLI